MLFGTIDLHQNRSLCIKFRRDSYATSFSNGSELFDSENGADGRKYISWLSERISDFPEGCVHAYVNGSIVGQIESRIRSPELGYVNLFYLVPKSRGSLHSTKLHDYLISAMQEQGVKRLQLTVSTTNYRALGYYGKHGWKCIGPRDSDNRVQLMELIL